MSTVVYDGPYAIEQVVFPNGLRLVCGTLHTLNTGAWVVHWTRSLDAEGELLGLSHFVEHMMVYKRLRSHPLQTSLLRRLDQTCDFEAATSDDAVFITANFGRQKAKKALSLIAEATRDFDVERRTVESERRVILHEMDDYQNDPEEVVEMVANRLLWRQSGLRDPAYGTKSAVSRTSRADIIRLARTMLLNTKRMTIGYVGPDSPSEVQAMVRNIFRHCSPGEPVRSARIEPTSGIIVRHKPGVSGVYVACVTPVSGYRPKRRIARAHLNAELLEAMLIQQALVANWNSELRSLIRDAGLAYTMVARDQLLCLNGAISIKLRVAKRNLRRLLELIDQVLTRLATHGLYRTEFNDAKDSLLNLFALRQDNVPQRAMDLATLLRYTDSVTTYSEIQRQVRHLTLKGVNSRCRELYRPGRGVLALVGSITPNCALPSIATARWGEVVSA